VPVSTSPAKQAAHRRSVKTLEHGACFALLTAPTAKSPERTELRRPMLREYTDKNGTPWRVWDVYPGALGTTPGTQHLANGWLCFESPSEKRRLAPIPSLWQLCDCSLLEEMCARASFISPLVPPPDIS
jgi:hypothetical protein